MTTDGDEELPMYNEAQEQHIPSAPLEVPQDEAPVIPMNNNNPNNTAQQTSDEIDPINMLHTQFPNIDVATINVCYLNLRKIGVYLLTNPFFDKVTT